MNSLLSTKYNILLEFQRSYQQNLFAFFPWTVLTLGAAV